MAIKIKKVFVALRHVVFDFTKHFLIHSYNIYSCHRNKQYNNIK